MENPYQQKTSAVKGKEIKKRKNLTYSEKYERVKLIDSVEGKNNNNTACPDPPHHHHKPDSTRA